MADDPTNVVAPPPQQVQTAKVEPPKSEEKRSGDRGTNPILAVAIAIVIALVLSGISFMIFMKSDTRKNVELIQKPATEETTDSLDIDETSPLKIGDLESIRQSIIADLEPLRSDVDFNPNELTDAALGL